MFAAELAAVGSVALPAWLLRKNKTYLGMDYAALLVNRATTSSVDEPLTRPYNFFCNLTQLMLQYGNFSRMQSMS